MKLGTLTPVYKKKKDKTLPSNYRGITVIATLGKVLEKIIKSKLTPILNPTQNSQQRGFTSGTSPLNAALLVHEQIMEAKAAKTPLYIAFLDAKSAFDVVSHQSLMRKLYIDGVQGDLWRLINDIFKNANSRVKWNGHMSEPFTIQQGVRQGGILSADQYKRYNNNLLDILESSVVGGRIGAVSCPSPTCADDVALLASSPHDLQVLINIAYAYSCQERYELQPVKSMILPINTQMSVDDLIEINPWHLGNQPIPVVNEATHIGITRDIKTAGRVATVRENVIKARRALYSMMGAGLHGVNGLSPTVCHHLFQVYILPILTYGLEVLLPTQKELHSASMFYESTLRQLLSLPNTVAKPSMYILLGAIPLEGVIHRKALTMFGNIARDSNSIECKIAERQVLMKTNADTSWFSTVRRLLAQYDLPSALDVIDARPRKQEWSKSVKHNINQYWETSIKAQAQLCPSLKHINVDSYQPESCHPIIESVSSLPSDVHRAAAHLRLATGTFLLQTKRAQFNQYQVDETCCLCESAAETRVHFIAECNSLHDKRQPVVQRIFKLLHGTGTIQPEVLSQVVMDPTHGTVADLITPQNRVAVLREARILVYHLETERAKRLAKVPTRKKDGLLKGAGVTISEVQ
jgi:hypothetical protein